MYDRSVRIAFLAAFALALAGAFALSPIRAADVPRDARALVVLDRDGNRLGTVLGRDDRRTFTVPLAAMGRWFPSALVAAEDGRFARDGAIDPLATARAIATGLARRRIPSGASTIEMQLARTLATMPPGLRGKLAEILMALRIEAGMSKPEILVAYANRAPMSANLYGVAAAARAYFGIDAAQLDLAQSAALAAMPNAPSALDPYERPAALRARMRYVLARMRALGAIDASAERSAASEDLALAPRSLGMTAPQFCFFVARHTRSDVDRVRTTLDSGLQRFVEMQLRSVVGTLARDDVSQAAAIVVENRTGAVRAYAGSLAYDDRDGGRNDGVQALRQPGSALKPFLYELAFERRTIRPYDILADVPTSYALPGARAYAPRDYSTRYLGPVRPRIALADSLNVPAVRVLEATGVDPFLQRLHALGFTHLARGAEYYGLGLTLGAGEVSLWELARAYLTMERGGATTALATNEDDAFETPPAVNPQWAEVVDILADRHARAASFGVDSILALPFAAAVKTGTSSDFRDTWTVGFSRDYTVAVWAGNFDGRAMHGISGVTGAGPIWNRIMLRLHERDDPPDFDSPRGWTRTAICATRARFWSPDCARADEWLDRDDLAALRTRGTAARPLGPQYDAWLAEQSMRTAGRSGARIVFPREAAVFSTSRGAAIDVVVASSAPGTARLTIDGRDVVRRDGAYVVPLRLGRHLLQLHANDGDARRAFEVVPAISSRAPGFTFGTPHRDP